MNRSYSSHFISLMLLCIVAVTCTTMTACGMFTVTAKPETPEQVVAATSLTLDGIRNAHASLITTGRINQAVDAELVAQESAVEQMLVVSRMALRSGDVTTAKGQIELMNAALLALNARIVELQAKQGVAK